MLSDEIYPFLCVKVTVYGHIIEVHARELEGSKTFLAGGVDKGVQLMMLCVTSRMGSGPGGRRFGPLVGSINKTLHDRDCHSH